jgi:hypothetical protein
MDRGNIETCRLVAGTFCSGFLFCHISSVIGFTTFTGECVSLGSLQK